MEYDYKLDEICHLPPRWDDRDAKEPDQDTIAAVRSFLKSVKYDLASIMPLANGGILVESNDYGYDIEVEFNPSRKTEICWKKRRDV